MYLTRSTLIFTVLTLSLYLRHCLLFYCIRWIKIINIMMMMMGNFFLLNEFLIFTFYFYNFCTRKKTTCSEHKEIKITVKIWHLKQQNLYFTYDWNRTPIKALFTNVQIVKTVLSTPGSEIKFIIDGFCMYILKL